ncbi:CoA-disulfide reductase [Borrelia sp. RT1S]|uniref:CoA-disulfide reductase n=1 Tax=Borrelia sp. RT1S TaxID=2898580 RepID=UPI001E5CC6D5|nr:CoA-disulfide reductase [Borrelia sp. RT1S]UGQ17500.1 CoA-disulfide reductase [Borrelia sp. RT1S]
MKIIIIGGTAAGTSAAAKAKRINKELNITIYEKTNTTSFGACGLPYFIGGFFNDVNKMIARTPDEFERSGISVRTEHEVIKVDTKSSTLKVKNLKTEEVFSDTYDKLVIATGGNPIIPPIENIQLNNFYTLRRMQDGTEIRKLFDEKEINDIVIIGAGYIGVEMVEAARARGKNVRVIQLDKRILTESFDKEITDIMEAELIKNNVLLHTNEFAKSLVGKEKIEGIITNKGAYKADLVILSTGIRPSTEFVEGQLETLKNGAIVINEYGETSVGGVYSAGDCATVYNIVSKQNDYIPLATTASKLGKIVGENLAGQRVPFRGTLGSASIKVLSLEAARTGLTEESASRLGIECKSVFIKDKNHTNYYPTQEDLYIKLIYNKSTEEIIGAQIIGKDGAALRMHALSLAVYSKLTTRELGMLDFAYSPPFSKTWDALNIAGNAAK